MILTGPNGLVLSDLHLFAKRSNALACWRALESDLHAAEVLVFNGDTFDFRWSTLQNQEETLALGLDWLRRAVQSYPRCEFHFILGNHDCMAALTEGLHSLSNELPRFHWSEYSLRLGSSIFLHGDCAHYLMDGAALGRYRESWQKDGQRGNLATAAYQCCDRLGLTPLAHQWQFPRRATVLRVRYYLDQTQPGWRHGTRHCFFGHTHLPFSDYQFDGVTFHNTGSAIRGMKFNPLSFDLRGSNSPTRRRAAD